jgi:hypothetical protein
MAEEKLSPSDSLNNKEKTTYRSAKQRKSIEKHKRVTGDLKI